MSENVKFECACDIGYDKGVLKKTLENNIFTLFGNLNQNNSIVIRYHGLLTADENDNSTTFYMFYYFDNHENDKKIIKLEKCHKCTGDCYCTTLDLDINHTLHFGFFDNNNNYEQPNNSTFKLEITPDPISNIMQRYGFEQNVNLPTIEENNSKIYVLKGIINKVKAFFSNIIHNNSSI